MLLSNTEQKRRHLIGHSMHIYITESSLLQDQSRFFSIYFSFLYIFFDFLKNNIMYNIYILWFFLHVTSQQIKNYVIHTLMHVTQLASIRITKRSSITYIAVIYFYDCVIKNIGEFASCSLKSDIWKLCIHSNYFATQFLHLLKILIECYINICI